MSEQKVISIEPHDEMILVVVQCTQMDEDETCELQAAVSAAAAKARHLPVVLDLSRVEIVPSLSIGALVNLLRELEREGQRFILAHILPGFRVTLAITRLDKVFEVCDNVDDALARIRDSS